MKSSIHKPISKTYFQSLIDAVHLGRPAMTIGDHVSDGPTTKVKSFVLG
jgi:hypothetical protein